LRQQPPPDFRLGSVEQLLAWAISNWNVDPLLKCRQMVDERSSVVN